MRQDGLTFIFFLSASLLCASSPVLAQDNPNLGRTEFVAKWEAAQPRFLKGRERFFREEYDRAEAELKACLEILPGHADALLYTAQIHYRRGNLVRALAGIEKAERSHGAFAGADSVIESQRRQFLLEGRKKKEREIAAMEEIFYSGACSTDDEMLKLPESIEALRREIQAINVELNVPPRTGPRPLPADYSYVHGNILFKLNRASDAAGQYLKAIESDSRHAGAYNNLINLFYMAKDYGRALEFIDRAETNGVDLNHKLKQAIVQLAKK